MSSPQSRIVPRWLLVTTLFVAVLYVAQVLIPLPYVIERPGPVANTLGDVQLADGEVPMIQIDGATTYPVSGELNLLTVTIVGNPDDSPGWLDLLAAAFDPAQDIVPMEFYYPEGVTAEDRKKANQAEMTSSQDAATAASLDALNIPYSQSLSVGQVSESGPASGVLETNDQLVAVNGAPVSSYRELRAAIMANGPGSAATFSIVRDGVAQEVQVTPVGVDEDGQQVALIGVSVATAFEFPIEVSIQVEKIGGPSAGLMFALGITDMLIPLDLAKGLTVSGTGTIDSEGNVGAIGGLPQKVFAAERALSDLMFIPADQCDLIPADAFSRVTIVPVETLNDAIDSLTLLQNGASLDALPECTLGNSAATDR
jgi:PDZ domain-containing protein